MTTPEKCEAIVRRLVDLVNKGKTIQFSDDWGGNSMTVAMDGGHTHVGDPDFAFDILADNLYNCLTGGPGLSWAGTDNGQAVS